MYVVLLLAYINSTNITLGGITEHEENPGARKKDLVIYSFLGNSPASEF